MALIRLFAVLVALAGFALIDAGKSYAGATSITETEHQVTETFTDIIPCGVDDTAPYDITVTYNLVEHATFGPKSVHFTFTQTGSFTAVPQDSSLPTYGGHFTQWGGFNGNNRNASGTFTFSIHGTGSDGSKVNFSVVDHFNVTPGGIENTFTFERCH